MKYSILSLILFLVTSCQNTDVSSDRTTDHQEAWAFSQFEKVDSLNPILHPSIELVFRCPILGQQVAWEERNVLNPAAVVKGDSIYLFYRAQDKTGTSRIGMAVSADGLHFQKKSSPVFFPDNDHMKTYEWNYKKLAPGYQQGDCQDCFDGVEDPRIVEDAEGTFYMTYTAYDGKTARLCLASTTDFAQWTKHGLVLKEDKYRDLWSKSGAIVVEEQGNRTIAKKINGKYWMYFGDTQLFMATSDDLVSWEVCENAENGTMISVLHPRMGYFDSRLVEPGPYALYRDQGILLIYNASNAANFNDPNLPKFTYAAAQALYDAQHPYKLIARTKGYFIHPDKEYEKVGEVNEVCFVEGLVRLNDRRFLYYGTADSKIAVAVSDE